MRRYEAPAKVNLSLHVQPPATNGYHPVESLVQTIEWCDILEVDDSEETTLTIEGADLDPDDNLVTRAFEKVGVERVALTLTKNIPVAAGLGGGSSDAAAALVAAVQHGKLDRETVSRLAPELGADVALFLEGGTQIMTGFGEDLEVQQPLDGFAVAVVVPRFVLKTADVYRRWDEMEGPEGDSAVQNNLPPVLRDVMPMRNDLLPAALSLEPELGDFMADVRSAWGGSVLLTGSGSACFGFFASESEAADAALAIPLTRAAAGVVLRDHGVVEV